MSSIVYQNLAVDAITLSTYGLHSMVWVWIQPSHEHYIGDRIGIQATKERKIKMKQLLE